MTRRNRTLLDAHGQVIEVRKPYKPAFPLGGVGLHSTRCQCGHTSLSGDKYHHLGIVPCPNCESKRTVTTCPTDCSQDWIKAPLYAKKLRKFLDNHPGTSIEEIL